MSEIVNLRRMRKAKAREEAAARADANRARHGISKTVRDLGKIRVEKTQRDLAASKLDEN